ncbi:MULTISPECIES: esterase/lipase family protein [Nocardia]|uniref:esterase/lipase family protein n=1 Tax=Nocardia TaxID=1817 RepID=UPI00130087EE|nr:MULTISPECIES: alpha/beta fold hydrolase [Nocardia]
MKSLTSSRNRWWRTLTVGAVLAVALQGGIVAATHADPAPATPYPVPNQFLIDAIRAALQGGAASPPGTNDWACRPSVQHPEPVVLVHGILANRNNNWQTYGPLLANGGYCVFALTYNSPGGDPDGFIGGLGSMRDGAATLDTFIDRVRQVTGAGKVAIVGHSLGATMPYWYIKAGGGAGKVSRMVGLAGGVQGINSPGLSSGSADAVAGEGLSSSTFMRELHEGGIAVPGVAYTQIVTRYDEVLPYTGGLIHEPGVANYIVQDLCSQDYADHLSINSDPVTAQLVLNALDPEHPQPVECTLVLPAIGVLPTGSGG